MNGKPRKVGDNKIIRRIFGVQISEDHGKTWRIRALCDECFKSIEPPKLAKKRNGSRNIFVRLVRSAERNVHQK
ncbi:MAG: hypothetical protein K1X72_28510 [Pyrinomonadaceae bacterium]|nr:hypothetical protein [Pyrinomonadaceae bacterium]